MDLLGAKNRGCGLLVEFQADDDWIEIDHASDNVEEGPFVQQDVFDYFHKHVDPDDDRNAWLESKPGVELIGKEVCDEESDDDNCFSYRQRLLLPDGREAVLIYEDASVVDDGVLQGKYRVVRIEISNQPALESLSWLGQRALNIKDK
jgi:hypothetical protein